jgi:hypothetical protein
VNIGAIRNGISSYDRYSSSHSKALRAAMGFSFHATGVKCAKECRNESHTVNGSAPATKTEEKPGGVNQRCTGRTPWVYGFQWHTDKIASSHQCIWGFMPAFCPDV